VRIGDVAARAGVSTRMLRYYEEQRLLDSTRTPGGQRQYADGTVERVRLIQQFYAAGLSSRAIREVLPCADARKATPELLRLLAAERDRMDQRMAELRGVRNRLDDMITEATQSGHSYCPYPSA
jgi:MerR family redox-sensitive transcriptional activator SoxR